MTVKTLTIFLFVLVFGMITILPSFASPYALQNLNENSTSGNTNPSYNGAITVTTDKSSYNNGDSLMISGTTQVYISDTPVTVRIISPIGTLVKVDQVDLQSDRTYSVSYSPSDIRWEGVGTYQVKIDFGTPDRTAQTTFQFTGTSVQSTTPSPGHNPYAPCPDCNETTTTSTITLATDSTIYKSGDMIVITGHVTNPYPGQDVAIKITSPSGNVVSTIQATLGSNGDFITRVSTIGNIWFESGQYIITVQQGDERGYLGHTTFQFTGSPLKSSSPVTSLITASMDKSSYTYGDIIIISGYVQSVVVGTPLTVQILDPTNNLVQVTQVDGVDPNGKYVGSIKITGTLWKLNGTYTVKVQYGPPNVTTQTTFNFNAGTTTPSLDELLKQRMADAQRLQTLLHGQNAVLNTTQQDMANINQAKASQTIAAEVNVGANQSETKSIDNNVSVQTTQNTPDSLGVQVSANNQTGPKVIVFNLVATTINVQNLKDLGVMYDGKLIAPAPNMDAILHAKSTDSPSFAIVVTQSGVQVLVLVPHFSTHTITITNMSKVIPAVPEFGPIAGVIITISIISSLVISRRFSNV